MKKIVFVIETLFGGGAERVTAALANGFCKDANNQIHIVTYNRDETKEYPVDACIIRHEIGNVTGRNKIQRIYKRIARIRKIIKEIDPCCVISLGSPIIVYPLVVAMIGLGYPLVLSERNDPKSFPVSKFRRFFRLLCYVYSDGLVFQTCEAKSFFPKFIQNKGVVICNPITSKLPEPHQGKREHRIVNFCRLTSQKNLDLLIDAFSDICKELSQYSLHIYGEGEERERLETKIRMMGLSDRVVIHGYSNNIYADINNASLFVSSSNYEGISNSMLEAIALGIPSICTDCPAGGAREIIENGLNGFLVPVGDREKMAELMKKVLTDELLAKSISDEGQKLRDKISVAEISKKWVDLINKYAN